MSETFELKPISSEGVDQAIDKARNYRLLNDPEPAESICRDVLAIEPDNQRALVQLVLAMTDQWTTGGGSGPSQKSVKEVLSKLADEFENAYYTGLACEREARAYLRRGSASRFAYDLFREAMEWYEKAEAVRPAGNDDPILRWNNCARTIMRERLEAQSVDKDELPPLLE